MPIKKQKKNIKWHESNMPFFKIKSEDCEPLKYILRLLILILIIGQQTWIYRWINLNFFPILSVSIPVILSILNYKYQKSILFYCDVFHFFYLTVLRWKALTNCTTNEPTEMDLWLEESDINLVIIWNYIHTLCEQLKQLF